jgi:predicted DsbA family dithiol-disulfide isomerase
MLARPIARKRAGDLARNGAGAGGVQYFTLPMSAILTPIYFDYASTLCYVAWRIVRELEAEVGFEALWKGVPIRLRDNRSRPGNVIGPIERMKVMNVIAETGIGVTPPERWIDSEAALMGSELAREAMRFTPYHEGVFRAAFEEGRDIADAGVLGKIAEAAGMDRERFEDDLAARRMESRVAANKEEADRFSAIGYPTFILGDFPLTGIQPKETMRMLLRRFVEQRRRERAN